MSRCLAEETRSWSVRSVASRPCWPWVGSSRVDGGRRRQEATPKPAPTDPGARPAPGEFALPGEDPPRAFVPAQPRTVEEQRRVESLRYYAAARALEDRRQFSDAIKTLEKALASDPESTAGPPPAEPDQLRDGPRDAGRRLRPPGPRRRTGRPRDARPAGRPLQGRPARRRGPAQGGGEEPQARQELGRGPLRRVRAGRPLRGLAPVRQGRGVLRQGRRGPRREVERPALAVRPPPVPRQRRGPGLSPLRPGLPPGQEDRPGHQGLPARAGLRPGRAAAPALPLPDLPGSRPGGRGALDRREVPQAPAPGPRDLRPARPDPDLPEAGERDHPPAGEVRGGRPQERPAPVRPGRALQGRRPGREGPGDLQRACWPSSGTPRTSRTTSRSW